MSVPESEFTALQQQVQQQQQILQQILALQQQQTAHQQPVPESEDTMEDTLHSLPVKMDYSWSPTPALSEFLSMDSNLFLTDLMPSKYHTEIIEQYPPQKNLSYVSPQTVPSAFEQMNAQQKAMDSLLKHQRYVLSAVFRPLDVLAFELSKDSSNPNVDRFLTMMKHTRQLLLHSLASLTQSRKNVAFKSINRSFHAPEQEKKDEFIMAPEDFQLSVTKQHAVSKSLSEAHRFQKGSTVTARWSLIQQHQQQFQPTQPTQPTKPPTLFNQQTAPEPLQQSLRLPQNPPDDPSPVGGRLSQFFTAWTQLSGSYWLNNIIQHGFKIPFHQPPPLSHRPIPIIPFSSDQIPLLDLTIQDLLSKHAIETVHHPSPGYYSSIFVIPKKNKGLRPVFNLKRLNQYLKAPHFKMETLKEVSLLIQPCNYLTSIDLSDAFLHILVHPEYRKYLRFHWKGATYQYRTTPFGLSLAPWLFTKICRPILTWARQQGIRISAYIDDWVIVADDLETSRYQTSQVLQKLRTLGCVIA
ncbi:hypothetical protein G6F16_012666 [Rhizopus arrhizus]|nr:hypothetical protein G6F22_009752 [Rhizopus arrhizus]KAG0781540.1 hypothetical protein G6F21_011598 [Rhizopus arrhizus]KAG0805067.1 hypothetical protein G6F20_012201 [Rhizopus arrhizus]KAG0821577.1 hypothetical protein G6F19_011853 [Rhizopus arrhizus]KAG0822442.1 hypothetical protein G6F18_011770 [Rhizopus arrhizus]